MAYLLYRVGHLELRKERAPLHVIILDEKNPHRGWAATRRRSPGLCLDCGCGEALEREEELTKIHLAGFRIFRRDGEGRQQGRAGGLFPGHGRERRTSSAALPRTPMSHTQYNSSTLLLSIRGLANSHFCSA